MSSIRDWEQYEVKYLTGGTLLMKGSMLKRMDFSRIESWTRIVEVV